MFVHTLPSFLIDFVLIICRKFKEINIRKTCLIPLLPTAKLCCVMSAWNALLVAFFLINIEVLIVFPLHGQTPSFCLPGLHTRTSPRLLLRSQDRHTNMTTSLALVMEEIADPSTLPPAMPRHIPLTPGQGTWGINKGIANRALETGGSSLKEACSGMRGWRRWERSNCSLSPSPEEPESITWKQVTKVKWTKGDAFPQCVVELCIPTTGKANCTSKWKLMEEDCQNNLNKKVHKVLR